MKGINMSKVHVLTPEVISKIAAGEVIERPASVVKELVENSLDAGAKNIEVSLKNYGKSYICVKDTGIGIDEADVSRIFFRHSTSKIGNLADLEAIDSFGFRGEALFSIAAVSDVVLRSKTEPADTGWETHIRGGERLGLKPVSMSEGTEIEINELFFNTPARRKFLKSDTTELNHILDIIIPYALLCPERRFCVRHNNSVLLELPPDSCHISRAEKTLHLKSGNIMEVKEDFPDAKGSACRSITSKSQFLRDRDISVHLLLGDINIQRSRKDMQFVFVNGRPVRDYIISHHLNQIYKLVMPAEVYPFFAVYINLPGERVDVNVHPSKREVKIQDERALVGLLGSMCERTLLSRGRPKQMEGISTPLKAVSAPSQGNFSFKGRDMVKDSPRKQYDFEAYKELFSSHAEGGFPLGMRGGLRDKLTAGRYIGHFLSKYLLFEASGSLLVIDQHAAHERITYERILEESQKGQIEVQRLLVPIVVTVSSQEKFKWEELKDKLEAIGLSTTLWDNDNVAIHTHPALIKDPHLAFKNVLSEEEGDSVMDTERLIRRACRSSFMAGDKVSPEEAVYFRDELLKCKDPFVCPHGRPAVIEIREEIFEKQFLRR